MLKFRSYSFKQQILQCLSFKLIITTLYAILYLRSRKNVLFFFFCVFFCTLSNLSRKDFYWIHSNSNYNAIFLKNGNQKLNYHFKNKCPKRVKYPAFKTSNFTTGRIIFNVVYNKKKFAFQKRILCNVCDKVVRNVDKIDRSKSENMEERLLAEIRIKKENFIFVYIVNFL